MTLLALLVFILVRSLYPARIGGRGGSQRFTLLAAFAAATTLRAAALRVARHGHRRGARLPGLAADGRDALPAAHRGRRRPRSSIAGWRRSSGSSWSAPGSSPGGRSATTRRSSAWRLGRRPAVPVQVVDRRPAGPDPARRLDVRRCTSPSVPSIWATLTGADRRRLLHRPDHAGHGHEARGRIGQSAGGPTARRPRRPRPAHRDRGGHDPADIGPRLHRPDQAADHRAPAGHHGAGDGPRHARRARHRRSATGPGCWSGR